MGGDSGTTLTGRMEISALADLLDVQALDLEIDRLLNRRAGLPELERYRSAQEQIEEAQERVAELSQELRALELEADKAEGELELLELKLTEHETRLFAGGMSARETEHMRLEVESLRGQREASETRVLGLLDRLDPLRDEIQRENTALEVLVAEKGELERKITEEWRLIDAELGRKEERKREALAPVPGHLVELYDRLRASKEGVAIGRLDDGTCGGCHVRLSPSEINEVRDSDPPRCVHCRRLLVL